MISGSTSALRSLDVDPAATLLDNNVMGHREAEPCPLHCVARLLDGCGVRST